MSRLTALSLSLALCASVVGAAPPSSESTASRSAAAEVEAFDDFTPPAELRSGWYARVDTNKGRFIIRLLPHQAPRSTAYFAALADGRLNWVDPVTGEAMSGHYYDGTLVQQAFGGERFEAADAHVTGRRAPSIFVPMEGGGPINFLRPYRVGMTRNPGGTISGAVFFVTSSPHPILSTKHPCFGEVVHGFEVVDAITQVRTYSNNRPVDPVIIERLRTFKIGSPDPLPEPKPHQPKPETFQRRERGQGAGRRP